MSVPKNIVFNGKRTSDNRCLKFSVEWEDGDFTIESIYSFFDFKNQIITDSFVLNNINLYKNYHSDLCWFCSNNVCLKNNCFCEQHYDKLFWFIQHMNNIVNLQFRPISPQKTHFQTSPPKLTHKKPFISKFQNFPIREIDFEYFDFDDFTMI